MKHFILIPILLLLVSCRAYVPVSDTSSQKDTTTDSVSVEVRQRPYTLTIPGDSVKVWFPAAVLSNPQAAIYIDRAGPGGRVNIQARKDDQGNLEIMAFCREMEQKIILQDSIIKRLRVEIKETESHRVVVEKPGLFTRIWRGYSSLAGVLLAISIAWWGVKRAFKIK